MRGIKYLALSAITTIVLLGAHLEANARRCVGTCYGVTSSTGLQRNYPVRSYFRSNGKFIGGYTRSRRW